ncbi:LPS assembly lipoprotein LptE [Agaribacterium sp. ZY112]|uniref:LPS-assembly lipoprotein LptE n=1 Tax=Agaribacterium sp. ZY112 TaxID=3233574 RepID=UPI003525B0D4
MRVLAALVLSLCLASCGWQLRGSTSSDGGLFSGAKLPPIDALHLSSQNRNDHFYRSFLNTLTRRGINHDVHADLLIQIGPEKLERKPLSYSSNGSAAQYLMTLSVQYQASKNGEILVAQRSVTARRNYDFNPDEITAKDREQEELLSEMRSQLVEQILASVQREL